MRTGFHAVQLNQTVRGVRVKILRPEYLAFLAFLCLLSYVKSVPSCALYHMLQLLLTLLGPSGLHEHVNNVSGGRTVF